MFRKTDTSRQLSLQSNVYQHLNSNSSGLFTDETGWHNIFYKQVVSRIDENLFSKLYSSDKGSPNAPLRTLIGMMILKEGAGYSDKKLFEDCRFNLLTRKALGFVNINDPIPVESTYYLLRKRIADYYEEKGVDLFEVSFKKITREQIIEFEVSGESIRMDSKLIGGNIAFYSRYELIHTTLSLFHKNIYKKQVKLLSNDDRDILDGFIKEKPSATVYNSTKKQITDRLMILGKLVYAILSTVKESDNKHYQTLKRVFSEQFKVLADDKIEITASKEITAKSVQSPHDTDCDFRSKNGKNTKGYNHNFTETCDKDNAVNLIIDPQTATATHPDNKFTKPAIGNSQGLLQDKIKNAHTDGAYNSQENQDFTKEEDINFYLTGFQGKPGRYDLAIKDDGLCVFDTQTNTKIQVTPTKNNKYRIKTEKGFRYFTDKEIESCRLRKQVEELPKEIGNKRNNVEATIYQIAYYLRKDKTKYRGYFKNKIWAILRSLWINFARIANYLAGPAKKAESNVINTLHYVVFVQILFFLATLTRLDLLRKYKMQFINKIFFTPF